MGSIFDRFGHLSFQNEAEVSQNFLLPLLIDYLGYQLSEILPEHHFPAFKIPLNRSRSIQSEDVDPKIRPDYVVTLQGDKNRKLFCCDSKGPDEKLDNHIHQLIAYCIGLSVNLTVVTNGVELRVYDSNELIFITQKIEDLDLNFSELKKLLGRKEVIQRPILERIQKLNLSRTLNQTVEEFKQQQKQAIAIAISDFETYLQAIIEASSSLELPGPIQKAFQVKLDRFPAQNLYSFQERDSGKNGIQENDTLSYEIILRSNSPMPLLLVGESGIGKSSLLSQILQDQAKLCVSHETIQIPVLVKLGQYTRNKSLIKLIADIFMSKGAKLTEEILLSYLQNGRMFILLDAFDETFDQATSDLEREIQSLIENFPLSRFIITTRHFKIPRLNPMRRYEIRPLDVKKFEAFVSFYLSEISDSFIQEVENKHLTNLTSNTLILTLLILLFKQYGELPLSKGQVLQAVVDHVCNIDQAKHERFATPLTWETRIFLLTKLAFLSVENGMGYSIDRKRVETILNECLNELEKYRKIQSGISLDQVIAELASTGFIQPVDEGIVFWHRAFSEHFAAFELAKLIESDHEFLEFIIKKPEWEDVLPIAISKAQDSSNLIENISKLNLFIAAKGLLESVNIKCDTHKLILDSLIAKSFSQTIPIRTIVIDLICKFKDEYTTTKLYELLESPLVDLQKVAVVEIARRRKSEARELIYARLNWDEHAPTWAEGTSENAIIEALGELDDPDAHHHIIQKWREKPNIFTNASCIVALQKVIKRKVLNQKVADELLDFFLSYNEVHPLKPWGIADLLIAIYDENNVPRLIEALMRENMNGRMSYDFEIVEVLTSFVSQETLQLLINNAFDISRSSRVRVRFAETLAKSKGIIGKEYYEKLAQDQDLRIRSYGILGLGRFPFQEIKLNILNALHPPPYEQSIETNHEFAFVQEAAFEVLAKYGQLQLLLQPENRPLYTYNTSEEKLLDLISQYHITEMVPFLESRLEQVTDAEDRVNIALVMASLGYFQKAQKAMDDLKQDRWLSDWAFASKVLERIHFFAPEFAIDVIDNVLVTIEQSSQNDSYYLFEKYIEALERIGNSEILDRLCYTIQKCFEDDNIGIQLERSLRALVRLSPKDKESWLIDLLEKHPDTERNAIRRALELLGFIGTEKSIPILQKYLYIPSPWHAEVQITCFWAIHTIYKRMGILWFNDEEKLPYSVM